MRSYLDYSEHALLGMAQGIPGSCTLITKWQDLKIIRKARSFRLANYLLLP